MPEQGSPLNGLQCGGRFLDLSRPVVMGVLNITPDSFSDGGKFYKKEQALNQARAMVAQGASIIDVGGESTRPGAVVVSEQEELDRVVPVVEALALEIDAVISVDTSTPSVMRESESVGAGLLNDVRALERPGALEFAKDSTIPICLMHMQGEPVSMQNAPRYGDVVDEVSRYLIRRVNVCREMGIDDRRLVLDPGFGFGKSLQHNLSLLKHLQHLLALGFPLLVGVSRKSMIGAILDKGIDDRLHGSLAAAIIAVQNGASIIRVHDVGPTLDALKVVSAVQESA